MPTYRTPGRAPSAAWNRPYQPRAATEQPCEPQPYTVPDSYGQLLEPTPTDSDYSTPGVGPQDMSPTDMGAETDAFAGANVDGADAPTPQMPSGLGAVASSQSPSMHMIGDYFGAGYFLGDATGFATVSSAGGDRRFKAADNLNPLPQDRVFFNYHHFHNAVIDVDGLERNVDRYTLGYERKFLADTMSLEVRVPIQSGLNSDQFSSLGVPGTAVERTSTDFGNISLTLKAYVCDLGYWKVLSGLAMIFPTAEDAMVYSSSSNVTTLENEAFHLQPYLGLSYAHPCDRFFTTVYGAVDFDTNGNTLSTGYDDISDGLTMTPIATVQDQTLLYIDWQMGYWLYQDFGHGGYLNGIAPILELHYTKALESPVDGLGVMNNPFGEVELLNLTGGLAFNFRNQMTFVVYGAAPLKREEAQLFGRTVSPVFDAEFGAQLVYRY